MTELKKILIKEEKLNLARKERTLTENLIIFFIFGKLFFYLIVSLFVLYIFSANFIIKPMRNMLPLKLADPASAILIVFLFVFIFVASFFPYLAKKLELELGKEIRKTAKRFSEEDVIETLSLEKRKKINLKLGDLIFYHQGYHFNESRIVYSIEKISEDNKFILIKDSQGKYQEISIKSLMEEYCCF